MAYSDFKVIDLQKKFKIKFEVAELFPDAEMLEPSNWLIETLAIGQTSGITSEKSRSERIVSPILFELRRRNNNNFTIYSGENLDVDPEKGLKGECDFILSFSKITELVQSPIFCITEAKKHDLEKGLIQCSAQLIGTQQFNKNSVDENRLQTFYGCSTNGVEWRFLKLKDNIITLDLGRYYFTQLKKLLGALQKVIDTTKAQL